MEQNNLFKEYEGIFEESGEVGLEKKEKKMFGYSPFALQDAIGERNTKKIWIEYEKLRFAGIEAEELIHQIISKVKSMTAINLGAIGKDLNIKDYPYNKSKRDLKNWNKEDLKNFYAKLVEIYHFSRMGGDELDLRLEKLLLNI